MPDLAGLSVPCLACPTTFPSQFSLCPSPPCLSLRALPCLAESYQIVADRARPHHACPTLPERAKSCQSSPYPELDRACPAIPGCDVLRPVSQHQVKLCHGEPRLPNHALASHAPFVPYRVGLCRACLAELRESCAYHAVRRCHACPSHASPSRATRSFWI